MGYPGNNKAKLSLLFLSVLATLTALGSTAIAQQRGLTAAAEKESSFDPGEIVRDCADCPELVVVPAGEFVMGSSDALYEKPERTISIRHPFAIGRREISFMEWDQCADTGGCKHRPDDRGWGRGDRPVINVSWDDA